MDITGEVYRTFPVYGIPTGGVGRAKILHFKTDSHDSLIDWHPENAGGSLPGCTARRTAEDLNRFNAIGGYQNRKLRCAEYAAV